MADSPSADSFLNSGNVQERIRQGGAREDRLERGSVGRIRRGGVKFGRVGGGGRPHGGGNSTTGRTKSGEQWGGGGGGGGGEGEVRSRRDRFFRGD